MKTTLATLTCVLVMAAPTFARAQAVELDETDQNLIDGYQVMQGVTMGLLTLTAGLGAINLYNLPTSFGDGACADDASIFGDYGCDGRFSLVHGIAGIATLASYTATGALAIAAPDLEEGTEDTVTDVLGWIHGVGIGLTGVFGILAANPGLIGLSGQAAEEFSRHLRVVHFLVAFVTASAFATQMVVDYVGGPL